MSGKTPENGAWGECYWDEWERKFTWKANTLAKLASIGSVAKANVSPHSSTGWMTCSIFGWRYRSSCFTDALRSSVTVSFRFGLCSFSAQRFSNRNIEHSCNKRKSNDSQLDSIGYALQFMGVGWEYSMSAPWIFHSNWSTFESCQNFHFITHPITPLARWNFYPCIIPLENH